MGNPRPPADEAADVASVNVGPDGHPLTNPDGSPHVPDDTPKAA